MMVAKAQHRALNGEAQQGIGCTGAEIL